MLVFGFLIYVLVKNILPGDFCLEILQDLSLRYQFLVPFFFCLSLFFSFSMRIHSKSSTCVVDITALHRFLLLFTSFCRSPELSKLISNRNTSVSAFSLDTLNCIMKLLPYPAQFNVHDGETRVDDGEAYNGLPLQENFSLKMFIFDLLSSALEHLSIFGSSSTSPTEFDSSWICHGRALQSFFCSLHLLEKPHSHFVNLARNGHLIELALNSDLLSYPIDVCFSLSFSLLSLF